MEMREKNEEGKGGVHNRPAVSWDVGEDVWIIPSNKSY